jgi:hypothetical protein
MPVAVFSIAFCYFLLRPRLSSCHWFSIMEINFSRDFCDRAWADLSIPYEHGHWCVEVLRRVASLSIYVLAFWLGFLATSSYSCKYFAVKSEEVLRIRFRRRLDLERYGEAADLGAAVDYTGGWWKLTKPLWMRFLDLITESEYCSRCRHPLRMCCFGRALRCFWHTSQHHFTLMDLTSRYFHPNHRLSSYSWFLVEFIWGLVLSFRFFLTSRIFCMMIKGHLSLCPLSTSLQLWSKSLTYNFG